MQPQSDFIPPSQLEACRGPFTCGNTQAECSVRGCGKVNRARLQFLEPDVLGKGLSLRSSPRLHRALPGMMQWIRSQRPGESGINIITADFVELGEFISAVITLNYHLDDEEDDAT